MSLLLSVPTVAVSDARTLQNLLSAPGGGHMTSNGADTIQIIQVSNGDLVGNNGNIWHVLPTGQSADIGTIIALNQAAENEVATGEQYFCGIRLYSKNS